MTKTLQERFEERFEEVMSYRDNDLIITDDVLAFIEQELELQRKGIVEEIEQVKQPEDPHSSFWQLGFERARKTIINLVEGYKE